MLVLCAYVYIQGDRLELKCILSKVDGQSYCVRDRKQLQHAVDLLARTVEKCTRLVQILVETHPEKDATVRLQNGYNPKQIMETLPTSEYTAFSENKGEKLAFCLNRKNENNNELIDDNTLMFVALHELSHIATESIGHEPEFWANFKFLLDVAVDQGLYSPENYGEKSKEYCGMKITDNPYYSSDKS
jgi:hypothetical protein